MELTELTGQEGTYRLDPTATKSGGQAVIYPATTADGSRVAVKVARDRGDRLSREFEMLRRIGSADPEAGWAVPVLDSGLTPDGRSFMVMPWFDQTLLDWILDARPPLERRFAALAQAARAVVMLHRSSDRLEDILVHRDIKPENYLVAEEGSAVRVCLADLGIAKEGRLLERGRNTVVYSQDYAPPEQRMPLDAKPDPSVDVHALAAMTFYCLCGMGAQSVRARESLWKALPVARLLELHRGPRSSEEEREYAALRAAPLGSLLDLTRACALSSDDRELLAQRLTELVRNRVEDPSGVAARVMELLVPVLERALDPDPRTRLRDAQLLYAACVHSQEVIERALGRSETLHPRSGGHTRGPSPVPNPTVPPNASVPAGASVPPAAPEPPQAPVPSTAAPPHAPRAADPDPLDDPLPAASTLTDPTARVAPLLTPAVALCIVGAMWLGGMFGTSSPPTGQPAAPSTLATDASLPPASPLAPAPAQPAGDPTSPAPPTAAPTALPTSASAPLGTARPAPSAAPAPTPTASLALPPPATTSLAPTPTPTPAPTPTPTPTPDAPHAAPTEPAAPALDPPLLRVSCAYTLNFTSTVDGRAVGATGTRITAGHHDVTVRPSGERAVSVGLDLTTEGGAWHLHGDHGGDVILRSGGAASLSLAADGSVSLSER